MPHPLAGQTAPRECLADIPALLAAYHEPPEPGAPGSAVAFGTSGHRGSALKGSFNEIHLRCIAQAVCDHRRREGIDGPLLLGRDSHALSAPAQRTVVEVLAANGVQLRLQAGDGLTPTPAISRAILAHNRSRPAAAADGLVMTPSHNPPEDGGIKYNPPHGGPADQAATAWIEKRANELMAEAGASVRTLPYDLALELPSTRQADFLRDYVVDLEQVVDMKAIAAAGLRLGAAPLGGATLAYWQAIAACYGLDLEVLDPRLDPAFSFVPLDHDGRIRMDCSSPHAMAGLVAHKDRFDIAWGNDADGDRHGIVLPSVGLMNPNHYLAVAIDYLLRHRPDWPAAAGVGKTLVSSSLIDRVVAGLGRSLVETPVGFKWFSAGLADGSLGFGGEESAGASFLRFDGSAWSTDKDGIILALLAAEIAAVTGLDPARRYRDITARHGAMDYIREDAPLDAEGKRRFKNLTAERIGTATLAGDPIVAKLTRAPGNDAPIGGIKVVTEHGWFAARPSGTEDICKLYAESARGAAHLATLVAQARDIIAEALASP